MEDKLRAYMDYLFRDVKPTRKSVELKEEILQNLIDKYRDLLAEGKTPEAAYNIAVASIGDMDELLAGLNDELSFEKEVSGEQLERGKKKSALGFRSSYDVYFMFASANLTERHPVRGESGTGVNVSYDCVRYRAADL